MSLAPLDLFVAVKADVLALGGRLDALRVNAASGGLGVSSQITSLPLAKGLHHAGPDAVSSPAFEIAIDRAPVAKILGYQTPLAACLVEVQDAVDDAAHVAWRPSRSAGVPGAFRQQRMEQLPLFMGQICWIVIDGAHGWSSRI